MNEFSKAGFNGCIGSTDATHIIIEKCQYRLRQSHLGGKLNLTARTYNMTVNHRRRILSTTQGYPARWNDKTLVLFDDFVRGIYEGDLMQDVTFKLLQKDQNGNIIEVTYRGPWLITDNGYLSWSTTIPPFKVSADRKEIRWSEWLESLRKDVECTFGILKGRWRILKTGVRLHGVEAADKIWKTCCAFHNMLLEIDGLDSEWEGELGMHDEADVMNHIDNFALQRLHNANIDIRSYDASGMGPGDDINDDNMPLENPNDDSLQDDDNEDAGIILRSVKNMTRDFFRKKIVQHFDIKFQQHAIVWPSRSNNT